MASHGQVKLRKIWKLLKKCPDEQAKISKKSHFFWVAANGKTYRSLPTGKKGKGDDAEVEIPQVEKMVRFLEIDPDCAIKVIPALRRKSCMADPPSAARETS